MGDSLKLISSSSKQTKELAKKIAGLLLAGDLISLSGDLGAGKTCFTQGLAAGLGVKNQVNSPTYTIIHIHEGRLPLYHLDLYRLEDPEELEEIGYREYYYGEGITVVEWGDKIAELLPADHLTVKIKRSAESDDKRLLEIVANERRSNELLSEVKKIVKEMGMEKK